MWTTICNYHAHNVLFLFIMLATIKQVFVKEMENDEMNKLINPETCSFHLQYTWTITYSYL